MDNIKNGFLVFMGKEAVLSVRFTPVKTINPLSLTSVEINLG